MSKEPFITFKTEADFEEAIEARIGDAIEEIDIRLEAEQRVTAELRAEIDRLRAEIDALKSSAKDTVDEYAPFAAFPELQALVRKADMRPNSLPALVALEIWKSSANSKEFPHFVSAASILPTIPAGKKGERDLATVIRALENAAAAFLEANTGLGIKVDIVKGTPTRQASAKARIFRFKPVEEVVEEADSGGEQQQAAE
jgi:hypothetical protein